MAFNIPSNLNYKENQFLETRQVVSTKTELAGLNLDYYPQGYLIYCIEGQAWYQLDKYNIFKTGVNHWKYQFDTTESSNIKIFPTYKELEAYTGVDGEVCVCTEKDYFGLYQYSGDKWDFITQTNNIKVSDKETESNEKDAINQIDINKDNVLYFKETVSQWQSGRTYSKGKIVYHNNRFYESLIDFNKGTEPKLQETSAIWKLLFEHFASEEITNITAGNDFIFDHNLETDTPVVYTFTQQEDGSLRRVYGIPYEVESVNRLRFTPIVSLGKTLIVCQKLSDN